MSFTQVTTTVVQSDNNPPVTFSQTITNTGRNDISESVAANATNLQIHWAAVVANIKSILISTDLALTVKTNSSGSPAQTLTLVANQPYEWNTNHLDALLLTPDVTTLYVTNASNTTAANFSIRCLYAA